MEGHLCCVTNHWCINLFSCILYLRVMYTLLILVTPKPKIFVWNNECGSFYRWANITVPSLLLKKLFPGQVTAIFTRRDRLNPLLNPDSNLVGLRVPDFHFIRQLVRSCQCPIALTSANKSGHQSTLKIEVSIFIGSLSLMSVYSLYHNKFFFVWEYAKTICSSFPTDNTQ